jgi:hypothetical protein
VAPSLAQAAEELYAMPPAGFTAARDELARQARAAGERDAAAQIRKLARPTVSAWLVNQLVRASGEQMSRLFEVGQSLHDAQRELAGDRLRELSARRRQVIAELLPEASRLAAAADVSVSTAALDEVRATLEAALADANARTAVRSGQLTRALTYAGLGEVDLTAALAVVPDLGGSESSPRSGARPGGPAPGAGRTGGAGRSGGSRSGGAGPAADTEQARAEQSRRAVETAEAAAAAAETELSAAESQAASLAEQRQFLGRRVSHLRRELEHAEAEEGELARTTKEAQHAAEVAAKALARAQRELDKARQRAGTR